MWECVHVSGGQRPALVLVPLIVALLCILKEGLLWVWYLLSGLGCLDGGHQEFSPPPPHSPCTGVTSLDHQAWLVCF